MSEAIEQQRMRRPRILHLVHERMGAVGGIQRFDARVLQCLSDIAAERGYELDVIAMHGVSEDYVLPAHTRFQSADGSRRKLLALLLQSHWRGALEQVFVGHVRIAKIVWPVRSLFRKSRYVLFAHGIESWDAGRSPFHRTVSRALINSLIDDIVAVSRFTAARMIEAFELEDPRIHILPNALNVSQQTLAAPLASSAGSERSPVILTVARMARHDMEKGIPSALLAVAQLRSAFPQLRYRIVGDGELRAVHERLAGELGLAGHVDFLGRVPDEELQKLYLSSDVFLLPSSKEGFGIVFLEAWRAGLPVVCGNIDASAEVVDHGLNGMTVAPREPAQIAQALHQVLSDPALRAKLIAGGREKLLHQYSAARFMETLSGIVRLGAAGARRLPLSTTTSAEESS